VEFSEYELVTFGFLSPAKQSLISVNETLLSFRHDDMDEAAQ
jgi:hypothetical protein